MIVSILLSWLKIISMNVGVTEGKVVDVGSYDFDGPTDGFVDSVGWKETEGSFEGCAEADGGFDGVGQSLNW